MIKGGPKIIDDSLVLCLDAHDAKSYAGEPTTNLLVYPESINSGPTQESWSGTITQNAVTAPDGTLTATKIEATSGYVYEVKVINTNYNSVSFGVGDTITYSVWIKMLDGTQTTSNGPYIWNYNNPTYGIVARDLSGLGPEWKLYKMSYTVQSHQTNFAISYSASNGGVTGTYAIWHPQLEVKSYNTPYVKTSRTATNGWVDRSGNSNDGTLVNGTDTGVSHYRDGQVIMPVANSYLDFDGSDDHVKIDHSTQLNNAKTWEIWININSFPAITTYDSVFSKTANWNNDGSILLSMIYGSLRFSYGGYWGGVNIEDLSDMSTNTWYQVVGTGEFLGAGAGVRNKGYLNGVYKSVLTDTSAFIPTNSNALYLGDGNGGTMNGKIGLFRVYEDILTDAEILSNYNATKNRFT
jgi:hypothetical protein